jgi:hypothetical protein
MLSGKRFTLKRSILAIDMIDGKRTAVSVPEGAIIEVLPGSTDGDVSVEVLWDGRTVVMFVVDVNDRGAEITESSATAPPSNDASKIEERGPRATST